MNKLSLIKCHLLSAISFSILSSMVFASISLAESKITISQQSTGCSSEKLEGSKRINDTITLTAGIARQILDEKDHKTIKNFLSSLINEACEVATTQINEEFYSQQELAGQLMCTLAMSQPAIKEMSASADIIVLSREDKIDVRLYPTLNPPLYITAGEERKKLNELPANTQIQVDLSAYCKVEATYGLCCEEAVPHAPTQGVPSVIELPDHTPITTRPSVDTAWHPGSIDHGPLN